jgi:hypothetical protein
MKRLATFVLLSALPLAAGSVDVTDQSLAPVHQGAGVSIDFGVWNYGLDNPGSSPYPESFGFSVIIQDPEAATANAPGSTAAYYPGYLFQGWVESLDGSVSVPLYDPLAAQLGSNPGALLVEPGAFDSGGAPQLSIGVLFAMVNLSPEMAQALFGSSFMARIVLRDLGPAIVLGIGPGYTVGDAVSEPDVTGTGPYTVAGITGTVMVDNPEPATWTLAAGAAALFLATGLRSPAARTDRAPSSHPAL